MQRAIRLDPDEPEELEKFREMCGVPFGQMLEYAVDGNYLVVDNDTNMWAIVPLSDFEQMMREQDEEIIHNVFKNN